mmetsp:Transcript_6256/g.8129  ORF Transcript_6256/g.8129 Transcript_6256/m.8129 type:complete len:581 (-) Transcript_6256:27-1769(-)
MAEVTKERIALVLCDMQPDLLGSLTNRKALVSAQKIILEAARKNNWLVVYSGLQFKPSYQGVSPKHKIYGALSKLNSKLGDNAVHWFMEGYAGSTISSELAPRKDERLIWRCQHIPQELSTYFGDEEVTKVYVTGGKASGAVQITCQVLMDQGMEIVVVKECVQDDDPDRLNAVLQHVLPIYGSVTTLAQVIDDVGGLDTFTVDSRDSFIDLMSGGNGLSGKTKKSFLYASDCGRRGHGTRYIELLLERGGAPWKMHPTQTWYEDFINGEFKCPLGKKVVDFCDEPDFSKVSMYLSGREFLDEKDKVLEFAGRFMPKTYCLENGKWIGEEGGPPGDDEEGAMIAPWFIKETDKNLGGAAIIIVSKPSEILKSVLKPQQRYVVQQHIRNPLLTDDGRKTHLKFYVLLICQEDGISWTLYTYKGALLSISPEPWSPMDLSHDTQITIHRHPVPPGETEGWKQHWEATYEKCKLGTTEVIEKAIRTGKLKGRPKKQFEVFSVDWMPDEHGNIWMFEFNMSPAVCQKEFDNPSNRDKRRDALMQHDKAMLQEALDIVMPWEGGGTNGKSTEGLWDLAGEFKTQK